MTDIVIRVETSIAWWLKYYVIGAMLFARATGMRQDEMKMRAWVRKAITMKVTAR